MPPGAVLCARAAQAEWAGVAVMAVLLVVVALRGPDGSRRATTDGEEAAEATLTP